MDAKIADGISAFFAGLPDPRWDHTRRHKLVDIVVMAICAMICGAEEREAAAICNRGRLHCELDPVDARAWLPFV